MQETSCREVPVRGAGSCVRYVKGRSTGVFGEVSGKVTEDFIRSIKGMGGIIERLQRIIFLLLVRTAHIKPPNILYLTDTLLIMCHIISYLEHNYLLTGSALLRYCHKGLYARHISRQARRSSMWMTSI